MAELTMLRSSRPLSKSHHFDDGKWSTTAFSDPWEFDAETIECGSIGELHAILSTIETQRSLCVIHGRLKDGMTARGRRIMHDQRNKNGEIDVARFEMRPTTSWLCLDIDKMPCPLDLREGNGREMLAARLTHVCRELPIEFQNVSFSYAWSASAGVRSWATLSIHLWFWIANPQPLDQIKARAKAEGWPCDLSLMSPVQIHYTSAPAFVGASDPIAAGRSGFIELDHDAVTLSDWHETIAVQSAATKIVMMTPRVRSSAVGDGTKFVSTNSLDLILAQIGQNLHGPIRHAIGHYVATTAPEDRDYEGLKKEIKALIDIARKDKTITRTEEDFDAHADDAYLDRSIDGAGFKYEATPDVVRLALAKKTLRQWNRNKNTKR